MNTYYSFFTHLFDKWLLSASYVQHCAIVLSDGNVLETVESERMVGAPWRWREPNGNMGCSQQAVSPGCSIWWEILASHLCFNIPLQLLTNWCVWPMHLLWGRPQLSNSGDGVLIVVITVISAHVEWLNAQAIELSLFSQVHSATETLSISSSEGTEGQKPIRLQALHFLIT